MPREQVLSSLVEYSAFGTLRRLILEVVAFNLTPTQIQDLGKVFRAIDKKQRGTISLEDIKVGVVGVVGWWGVGKRASWGLRDRSSTLVPSRNQLSVSPTHRTTW